MHFNASPRELVIKLVYYGPGLSGKTSNLIGLHQRIFAVAGGAGVEGGEGPQSAPSEPGRLLTLETADDRTLFFDMLPLWFRNVAGDAMVRIKVFTVPGQPIHTASRRLVLQGADGLAFIADSQISHTRQNADSFRELCDNLKQFGSSVDDVPLVIQFNKRDLPNVRSDRELEALARRSREPVFAAVASVGDGVAETFIGLLDVTWRQLDQKHGLAERLRIDRDELLAGAALQIAADAPVEVLLARRLGEARTGAHA
ncbi:MAG: gliding motility protein [Myxococcales bacterium]|nr:gliding motility protein [Myxococcales bacterium]